MTDVPELAEGVDHVLAGEHVPEPEPETSPECMLFKAVVARAWLDMTASDAFCHNSSDGGRREDFDSDIAVRLPARRFLTLDFGDWKSDREEICDLADIDEPMLRKAAKKKLAAIKKGEMSAEITSLDAAFARLLESESTMSPEEIDSALSQLAELEAA